MRILLAAAVVIALVSGACAASAPTPSPTAIAPTASATGTASPGTASSAAANCLASDEVTPVAARFLTSNNTLAAALQSSDIPGAINATRLISSDSRAFADKVELINPDLAGHLVHGADAMDSAATALAQGNIRDGSDLVDQGIREMNLALTSSTGTLICK